MRSEKKFSNTRNMQEKQPQQQLNIVILKRKTNDRW